MSPHMNYWSNALNGIPGHIHENDPQEGWYRTRPRKGYRSLPVRIWRDEGSGALLALRDGKRVDPYEVWTWCCLNPVSVEAYEAVLERGEDWPDAVGQPKLRPHSQAASVSCATSAWEARTASLSQSQAQPQSQRANLPAPRLRGTDVPHATLAQSDPRKGSNLQGMDGWHSSRKRNPSKSQNAIRASDPYETDKSAIVAWEPKRSHATVAQERCDGVHGPDDAMLLSDQCSQLWNECSAWLERLGSIEDQVSADRCANYADALSDLEKKAEAFRTAEKKPVLDQGRVIDARWKPIVTAADEAKRVCKKAIEPFLIAETERLEREFMEQLKAENGDVSLLGLASLTAKAGTFGRTISLRRVRKVVVSDRTALINHYHRDPRFLNDESVQKLLVKLADHDLQAGRSVPGITVTEEKVAA